VLRQCLAATPSPPRAAPAVASSEVTGPSTVDRGGAANDGDMGRGREGRCCTYRCCGLLIFAACQACSGELMSHNTVKNIVANKGNIDYCIEVRQLCRRPDVLLRCPLAFPSGVRVQPGAQAVRCRWSC